MRTRQPRIYFVEVSRDSVTAGQAVGTITVLIATETAGVEKIMVTGHIGARPVVTVTLTEIEDERDTRSTWCSLRKSPRPSGIASASPSRSTGLGALSFVATWIWRFRSFRNKSDYFRLTMGTIFSTLRPTT